jgi:hypothetical protein
MFVAVPSERMQSKGVHVTHASAGLRTTRHHATAVLMAFAVVLAGSASISVQLGAHRPGIASSIAQLDGRDEHEPVVRRPTIAAAFGAEGYRAGAVAKLLLFDRAHDVDLQLFRVGDARGMLHEAGSMRGDPVGPVRRLTTVVPRQTVWIPTGKNWPSGVYFARLTAPRGRIGYAPFVLAPRRLGLANIAVVIPTQTWQAYNFRDDDGNGTQDTWYAGGTDDARLIRPFENRGVPPHYRYYDEPFLRWIAHNHYAVDVISDRDLNAASGEQLAQAYDLLIFEGHHEYVTQHEYDAVTRFRDLGGNLMFLSANTFFWKITIDDGVMTRRYQWRVLDRPEAALVGAEYWGWDSRAHGGSPWIVRSTKATRWIFSGTGLKPGSPFSFGGIEADHTAGASPRNVEVVAEIPNAFAEGRTAQMTYYRAPSGAQVFAAGAFSLACSVWQPPVRIVMANLIRAFSHQVPLTGRA